MKFNQRVLKKKLSIFEKVKSENFHFISTGSKLKIYNDAQNICAVIDSDADFNFLMSGEEFKRFSSSLKGVSRILIFKPVENKLEVEIQKELKTGEIETESIAQYTISKTDKKELFIGPLSNPIDFSDFYSFVNLVASWSGKYSTVMPISNYVKISSEENLKLTFVNAVLLTQACYLMNSAIKTSFNVFSKDFEILKGLLKGSNDMEISFSIDNEGLLICSESMEYYMKNVNEKCLDCDYFFDGFELMANSEEVNDFKFAMSKKDYSFKNQKFEIHSFLEKDARANYLVLKNKKLVLEAFANIKEKKYDTGYNYYFIKSVLNCFDDTEFSTRCFLNGNLVLYIYNHNVCTAILPSRFLGNGVENSD